MKDHHPLRRLGQNFLVNDTIRDRIIEQCELNSNDAVLEIGPGQGALTRRILPLVKTLTAIEADPRLVDLLSRDLGPSGLALHLADILSFDLASIRLIPLKVIGNIPYNISSPIVEKMLYQRKLISTLFLTVQLEFAQRLVAQPGTKDYSALTCLLGFFAEPRILFRIPANAFRPIPKVTSCLLRIDIRPVPPLELADEELFINVVKTAFFQRRKTLLNALTPLASREVIKAILLKTGIKENTRPEGLTSLDYARISNVLFHQGG